MEETYWIENLPNYPDDGNHLIVKFHYGDFPFEITKGEDIWIYTDSKNVEHQTYTKYWYVYFNGFEEKTRAFKNVEYAILYALNIHKKDLLKQISDCDKTIQNNKKLKRTNVIKNIKGK